MHYLFDSFGRYAGTSDFATERSTTVAPPIESPDYNWSGIYWVYAPNLPTSLLATSVPAVEPPAHSMVSPVEFKLLFTSQERVAIKAARVTDSVIDDFYDIVEDPRLTHVDLGLKSTKDALAYMVSKYLLTADRCEEILQGKVQ